MPSSPRLARIAGWIGGILLVLLLALGFFPWGMLRTTIEARAGERFGRPVTIGAMERVDLFGFTPTVAIRDVRVPQAAWAGQGDLARVRAVTVTFPVWPLLIGAFRPCDVVADGVRLALVRDARGRTNWSKGEEQGGGGRPSLSGLTIRDAIVSYADAKQDRQVTLRLAADPVRGLRGTGEGAVRGAPVRVSLAGAAIGDGAWPFRARIDGDALAMRASGTMDRALDTGAMTLDVTARAADLRYIDAVIEAGLFATRPAAMRAHVRHDDRRWTITDLKGTIGRSDLAGRLTVDQVDGRNKIDGALESRRFAFDDLSSARGRAEGRALEARIGPRLVPNTRIDIGGIDSTDGRLAFRVHSIIGEGSETVIDMRGVMVMDHQLLTLAPLRMRIAQGVVTGRAVIDQRGDRAVPTLTLDLALADGRVATFAGGGQITGRIAARARLRGDGDTIRAAVGRSSGSLGFVARDGSLPARYAAALGFDAGRALLADAGDRAGLRCLVARLDMRGGTGRGDPVIVDTAISQLTGSGTVTFPDERLAFTLRGAPKREVILRIPGSVRVGGTLQQPTLTVPPQVKSIGNIFKAIGNRISGNSGPVATDANCAALAARALR
ncbi:AsmA family protein [Sphingomonas rubra]|uniref:AsmA family protein n=1 Tax=Sphingomonas rubra TaxID=634430 RepID=A0A1I5QXM4_9SPHN|nr:AsmA family protein [Sphingomonas rubra]SFP51002.1 hypothetical protein SAMN04488241_102363 [Sphingomonas rubra]